MKIHQALSVLIILFGILLIEVSKVTGQQHVKKKDVLTKKGYDNFEKILQEEQLIRVKDNTLSKAKENPFVIGGPYDVFLVSGKNGRYSLNFSAAIEECTKYKAQIATASELRLAWSRGLEICRAGWLRDDSVRYPLQRPSEHCGKGKKPGVITYGYPEKHEKFDVFCYINGVEVLREIVDKFKIEETD